MSHFNLLSTHPSLASGFLLFAVLCLTACASTPEAPTQTPLPVTDLAHGAYSQLNAERTQLIHDSITLKALWQQAQVSKPVPTIDFTKQTVILAALGEHRTGGFRVDVTRVLKTETGLQVIVTVREPGEKCLVSQTSTQPYHFAAIPVWQTPSADLALVKFQVINTIIQCGK